MPKGCRVYLDDIMSSIKKIEQYTASMSYEEFSKNGLVVDAVIRNLEVIGEAVKSLPSEMKVPHPEIEWKKIAGLRDILIHEYFGVNLEIIWDVVNNKLPEFKQSVSKIQGKKKMAD